MIIVSFVVIPIIGVIMAILVTLLKGYISYSISAAFILVYLIVYPLGFTVYGTKAIVTLRKTAIIPLYKLKVTK